VVTDNNLSSELEADAAEEGWLRLQPSSEVPAVLGLDANSVAWAKANGPGSVLATTSDAAGTVLHVLGTVNGAMGFTSSALQELYQAAWEAQQAAAEAGPLSKVSASFPPADAFMAKDVNSLLHFSWASEQAAVTKAAAAYATGRALDPGAQVAKQLAALADPMAAAVVAGLDLGYFIASFTGWDELRADFYQAVEQAGTESAFVDAARSLEHRPQRRDRQPGTLPAGRRICLVGLQLLRREHLAGQRGESRPGSFSGHLT
jgi:hypothetical protein